jgi:hypothetical protein
MITLTLTLGLVQSHVVAPLFAFRNHASKRVLSAHPRPHAMVKTWDTYSRQALDLASAATSFGFNAVKSTTKLTVSPY